MQRQCHRLHPIKIPHHPQHIQHSIHPQHRWRPKEWPIPRLILRQSCHRLFILLLIPRKQRQRSYIQIHFRMIRRHMVARMTPLPPIRTSSHQEGIEKHMRHIIRLTIEEYRRMTQIMLQQSSLRPTNSHYRCRNDGRKPIVG